MGVVVEDDGMSEDEFKEAMLSLNREYSTLNESASELSKNIENNLIALFGK